jgi:hypothetical protein
MQTLNLLSLFYTLQTSNLYIFNLMNETESYNVSIKITLFALWKNYLNILVLMQLLDSILIELLHVLIKGIFW